MFSNNIQNIFGYKIIESKYLIIDKIIVKKKTRKWKKKSIIKTTVPKPNPNAFIIQDKTIIAHPAIYKKIIRMIKAQNKE